MYLIRNDTETGPRYISEISNGVLDWTAATHSMADWDALIGDDIEYWGKDGDTLLFSDLMDSLNIYNTQGGLDVTDAPTSVPSSAPTETPSISLVPSTTQVPSSSSVPSLSVNPSSQPSVSVSPSTSTEPSSQPSALPSSRPSSNITTVPLASSSPSSIPSEQPSSMPSLQPSESYVPSSLSGEPSGVPSLSSQPSLVPSTSSEPSMPPTQLSQISRTITDSTFDIIANDEDVTHIILETQLTLKKGGVLVCGSEGEIAPGTCFMFYLFF